MTTSLGNLQPKQLRLARSRKKYILFGGARAGGKSWIVRFKAKALCLFYPGIQVIIIRRTYPELVRNHINMLRRDLKDIARYNQQDKVFSFPNGSRLFFGYCDNGNDITRYQGAEYDVIFIDEATLLEEEWLKAFPACLRGVNAFPKRIYYTANPGGPSHGYLKRLFIDRQYLPGEEAPEQYEFIQALPQDNLALMAIQPGYIDQLKALPYAMRQAWLYGSWDINSGAVFTEFRDDPEGYLTRRRSHVIEPFDPPEHWPVYRSFDWGYNAPFSCNWYAVGDDAIYMILEWYGSGHEEGTGAHLPPETVFERIRNIESQHPWLRYKQITGIADPACWQAQTGISVAETASKMGVYFTRGDNKRIAGWLQMHYRLEFDEGGKARLYFFKGCKDTIRTLPLLQYDKHNVEDVDTSGDDHCADSCRYMMMARPVSPLKAVRQHLLTIYDPLATA